MQKKSFNPLEEKNYPQHERERVMRKFERASNLYGAEKAEDHLTPEEMQVMFNTMANKAVEDYDEKVAQRALWKIAQANGGTTPSSLDEFRRVAEKILNSEEKGALIAMMTIKAREPKDTSSIREIKN